MFTPFVATIAAAALGAVAPSFGSEPAVLGFRDAAGPTPAPTYVALDQTHYLALDWIEPISDAAPTQAASGTVVVDHTSFFTPDRVAPAAVPAVRSGLLGARRAAAASPAATDDEYAWRGAGEPGVTRLGPSAAPSDELAPRGGEGSVVEIARLDDPAARGDEYGPRAAARAVVVARVPTSTDEARAAAGAARAEVSREPAPAAVRVIPSSTDAARALSHPAASSALHEGAVAAHACSCPGRG